MRRPSPNRDRDRKCDGDREDDRAGRPCSFVEIVEIVGSSDARAFARIALVAFSALAMLSVAEDARAAAPAVDVLAEDGCPSADVFRQTVKDQLGRDPFEGSNEPQVRLRVRRVGEALVADVTLSVSGSSPRSRTLEGAVGACADLVRASALSVALALEADAPSAKPAAAPGAAPDEATSDDARARNGARASASGAPAESEASARDLRRDRFAVVASGMTTLGLLPNASTGGAIAMRLRLTETAWVGARGFLLPETRMPNDAFAMTLAAGGAGLCVEPLGSTNVAAIGCAHFVAGSLAVSSANVPMSNGGAKPFGAAAISAGARARLLGPVFAEGAVEAMVPVAHPTFLTDTCPPTGFEQPFSTLALLLGLGGAIP